MTCRVGGPGGPPWLRTPLCRAAGGSRLSAPVTLGPVGEGLVYIIHLTGEAPISGIYVQVHLHGRVACYALTAMTC